MHEVSNGQFLEELFHRLEFVPLQLPPLRDRPEDVQELSCFFLSKACLNHRLQIKKIDSSARSYLCRQRWPGNLRQLKNLMERAAILITSSTVSAEDLERLTSVSDSASNEAWFSKLLSFDELEKEYTQFVLRQTHGRKEETALILGINRRTLYRKLIEWGIDAQP
jgi:DNA-binding NtrC family response regulator